MKGEEKLLFTDKREGDLWFCSQDTGRIKYSDYTRHIPFIFVTHWSASLIRNVQEEETNIALFVWNCVWHAVPE